MEKVSNVAMSEKEHDKIIAFCKENVCFHLFVWFVIGRRLVWLLLVLRSLLWMDLVTSWKPLESSGRNLVGWFHIVLVLAPRLL